MRGYQISEKEYERIVNAEKECRDKRTSKKLSILLMRFKGTTIAETAKRMNCSEMKVKRVVPGYRQD